MAREEIVSPLAGYSGGIWIIESRWKETGPYFERHCIVRPPSIKRSETNVLSFERWQERKLQVLTAIEVTGRWSG